MVLLIYAVTALALLALVHRFVCRLSRAAALFLFLLPFVFVGPALVGNRVYGPIDKVYDALPFRTLRDVYDIHGSHNPATSDIYAQMIPWRQVVRESYAHGEWPLWNPYILCGDILAAAAQPAPFSPFTLVALLMPAALSFTFTAAIAFLVAAAGAFVFAREHGCRESAAAIAAAGFAYSSGMVLYILWPLGFCWALLPLMFLGIRRVARNADLAAWGLLTSAFVLLLLAGHPESLLHIVTLGVAYGLLEISAAWDRAARATAIALAAGVVALLICAMAILPNLEALPQSAEYIARRILKPRVTPAAEAGVSMLSTFFPFLHMRTWLEPAVRGAKGETAAVGSMVLALAVYASWRIRSRLTWFFAIVALVCVAAQAGWEPLMRVLRLLPMYRIAMNDRLAFGAAFALAVLAGLGAEEFARRSDWRGLAATFAVVLAVLGAGTYVILHEVVLAKGPIDWGEHAIAAELVLLLVAIAIVVSRMSVRVVLPLLAAVLLVQRVVTDGNAHLSFAAKAAYPRIPIFEKLRGVAMPFRVVGHGWTLIPGGNAMYGLEDARGYEAMTFARLAETFSLWCRPQAVFYNRVDDLSRPFLSMMNVRYAFADSSVSVPPGWREIARDGETLLFENPNALDRAFVPQVVRVGVPRGDVPAQMARETDFAARAWIETDGVPPHERANGPGRVTIRGLGAGRYTLEAEMDGDGWIVVSESAWKGWRAYLDGHRVKTQFADAAFLGIYTPKGRHHIRLVYEPASFVAGRAISFASLAAVAAFVVVRRRRAAFAR